MVCCTTTPGYSQVDSFLVHKLQVTISASHYTQAGLNLIREYYFLL